MASLREKIRSSRFCYLYNVRDSRAKGRLVLLSSSSVVALANALTTGLFYTTFLINNGINLVNISILTFVPYIASCFSIFTPTILERLPKRKWILAAGRLGYYLFFMLGVTVIPKIVEDQSLKTILFVATVFIGHILSAISNSGYTSWHINFLPEDVRAEHFGINSAVSSTVGLGFGVLFCLIADAFAGHPNEAMVIEIFRYVGIGFGLLDVFLLTRPDEYPYEKTQDRPKFRDVFVKPIQNKKFLGCILAGASWTFVCNLPGGVLNYYLLENLGLKYTYIQVINVIYPLIIMMCLIPCRRTIKKYGWIGTFAMGAMMVGLSNMLYSFTTPANYMILYPIVRILQHVLGAHFTDTPANNMAYLNLPNEDRTNYMSFNVLVANIAAFLGVMCGTWFVALAPDFTMNIFGTSFGHCQTLLLANGIGQIVLSLVLFRNKNRLTPKEP